VLTGDVNRVASGLAYRQAGHGTQRFDFNASFPTDREDHLFAGKRAAQPYWQIT
jgi:hypothetical protein